jgi:dihydroorotase
LTRVLVAGGTVVDNRGTRRAEVALEKGRIAAVASGLEAAGEVQVLDASGCFVLPGLVDLHTHLRDPGLPEVETVASGSRSAALGGFTALVAMPNTDPPIDSAEVVRYVREASKGAAAEVHCAGAITAGRAGERLAALGEMAREGVRIFTDDGAGVQDAALMRMAMEYAAMLGAVVADHCEDRSLAGGGHMHEGRLSSLLGIPGQPSEAETVMVFRDISLARLTGCRLHLLHLSAEASVELVRQARAQGVAVTCEVTPHHLALSDSEVAAFDPVFKVNPPLRTPTDAAALLGGLLDGTVDAVATDHAPHPAQGKELPFDQAPFGMLGLETALATVFTVLTTGRGLSEDVGGFDPLPVAEAMEVIVRAMSLRPARIAGMDGRQGMAVEQGSPANLCVFDPAASWVVDPSRSASLSSNAPLAGRKLTGLVRHTLLKGQAVVVDGELQW